LSMILLALHILSEIQDSVMDELEEDLEEAKTQEEKSHKLRVEAERASEAHQLAANAASKRADTASRKSVALMFRAAVVETKIDKQMDVETDIVAMQAEIQAKAEVQKDLHNLHEQQMSRLSRRGSFTKQKSFTFTRQKTQNLHESTHEADGQKYHFTGRRHQHGNAHQGAQEVRHREQKDKLTRAKEVRHREQKDKLTRAKTKLTLTRAKKPGPSALDEVSNDIHHAEEIAHKIDDRHHSVQKRLAETIGKAAGESGMNLHAPALEHEEVEVTEAKSEPGPVKSMEV